MHHQHHLSPQSANCQNKKIERSKKICSSESDPARAPHVLPLTNTSAYSSALLMRDYYAYDSVVKQTLVEHDIVGNRL